MRQTLVFRTSEPAVFDRVNSIGYDWHTRDVFRTRKADRHVTDAMYAQRVHIRRGNDISRRALALELQVIATHESSVREGIGGRQARGFWVPELAECRRVWAAAKRMKIDWPDDDGEWINSTFEIPF